MTLRRLSCFFALCLSAVMTAHAEDKILIGQTAGFTGPVGPVVKELTDGARVYIDYVNQRGGINGKQIELISLDDKFDPKLAAANCKTLVEERKVFSLFLTRATPHTEACLAAVKDAGVPLVAPSTGADVFHEPVNPWVFNVRAKYQSEVIEGVRHFATTGAAKIALVHVDDSFGQDVLKGFQKGLEANKLQPTAIIKFDRAKMDVDGTVAAAVKAHPDAVIIAGSAVAVSGFVQGVRKAGSFMQIMTLSNNSATSFIAQLGAHAPGIIVSQITPAPGSRSTALGTELSKLAAAAGIEASYASMEGFTAAKVLVEGLRRAGPNPTRARLVSALESIRQWDMGGMAISYSPTDHTGATFVELSIINSQGRFMR